MTALENLRQAASFEQCYLIEEGAPSRIRLADEQTLLRTHQVAEKLLFSVGNHPEALRIKQNLQCGPFKYPVYFAALDVLRAAFAKLPAGSWAIYSHPECLKSHVIWNDGEVHMRAFANDSEINGLRATTLEESRRVQIV